MLFPHPLARGRLIQRYKRFLADVEMDDGRRLTVHVPNPGAMSGMTTANLPVWVSRSDAPGRKLLHTLELIEAEGALVGVNTHMANRLAAEALGADAIARLTGYAHIRREVRYAAASRIDFLLEDDARPPCWLEVKSVTLSRAPSLAEFPDCVTQRGARHLQNLMAQVAMGHRAVMLFIVQRADCRGFDVAEDIDPAYHAGLMQAARRGVEVLCYDCDLGPEGIALARPLPWLSAPPPVSV